MTVNLNSSGLPVARILNDMAQLFHELRQHLDPEHDVISCWCCCLDCDFEYIYERAIT